VALALDARIRASTGGRRSLDDVLRALLARADQAGGVLAVDGDVLARAVDEVAPGRGGDVLAWTRTADEPARLAPALEALGLKLETRELPVHTVAGFSAEPDGDALRVQQVAPVGPAARAGLRPGDRIVRFDGAQPTASWSQLIAQKAPGAALVVEAMRAAHRLLLELRLDSSRTIACRLVEAPVPPGTLTLRDAWLGR
jgi:predicted metalloprotease with PDZ domain